MLKLNKIFIIVILLLLLFSSSIYAETTYNLNFEVVREDKCEMVFNEYGEFTKQLITYDEDSVTLQLDVKNTADEQLEKTTSEIFLVIDNSLSLNQYVNDTETRKDVIYNSAKELVTKLYSADSDFKIGVISFSSSSDPSKEGTIDDATLMQTLTTTSSDVLKSIEDINNTEFGSRTNIEAGLELAQNNFSGTADKEYIILITDGVPNNDLHGNTLQYSDIVMENTKNKLLELNTAGINLISVFAGASEAIEPTVGISYIALAEKVFGTQENPTAGKYYCVPDDNIKTIIENNVYNDIEIVPGQVLTNIVITDYFPQEIVDNFTFEYIASPNIGTVSATIDTTTNSIRWKIELLEAGETATLQYKLTLKSDFNREILDEIIPTNEKVNITDDQGDDVTSDDSPAVKVTEEEITPPTEPETPEEPDDTVVPTPSLPSTGTFTNIIIALIILLSIYSIYSFIRFNKN